MRVILKNEIQICKIIETADPRLKINYYDIKQSKEHNLHCVTFNIVNCEKTNIISSLIMKNEDNPYKYVETNLIHLLKTELEKVEPLFYMINKKVYLY